jgi:hypothetical protein
MTEISYLHVAYSNTQTFWDPNSALIFINNLYPNWRDLTISIDAMDLDASFQL